MKKILLIVALMVSGFATFAQDGNLPFLRVNADARTGGMGNTTMGESKGMYIYTNPTSFLQDTTQRFYGAYTCGILPKIDDSQILYHAASVGYRRGNQALMIGFRSLNGQEITQIGMSGNPGNTINPFDYSVDLTYARTLSTKFSAYVTGSFIQSYIGKTAFTGSASAGVYYRNQIKDVDVTIGAGFYDLGGLVKYGKKEYDQPTSVGLGGSFLFGERFNLAWTTRYFLLPSKKEEFVLGLGAEFKLSKAIDIRYGYQVQDNSNYATAGLGYTINRLHINVAYKMAQSSEVDNSLFLGCSVKF